MINRILGPYYQLLYHLKKKKIRERPPTLLDDDIDILPSDKKVKYQYYDLMTFSEKIIITVHLQRGHM